jgi:hypothetical protein
VRVTRYRSAERFRVEPLEGASVRETLRELGCDLSHGGRMQVRGVGRIDAVRFVGVSEPSRGVIEVAQLSGDADSLCLVGRGAEGAIVAGAIVDARAVELVLDVELLEPIAEGPIAEAAARVPSKQDAAPSWAAVAAATQAREAEEANRPEAPTPTVGDRVEHATFGICTVEKIDADEEFIMVRSATQRLLRLSLDVLRLELVEETGGVRVFRARAPRDRAPRDRAPRDRGR